MREGSFPFSVHAILNIVTQKKTDFLISECPQNLEYSSEFVNTYATLVPVLSFCTIRTSVVIPLLFLAYLHTYSQIPRSQGGIQYVAIQLF